MSRFSCPHNSVNATLRDMCYASMKSCFQGLSFIYLHLRPLNNLWGRYDPKTENMAGLLPAMEPLLHIELSAMPLQSSILMLISGCSKYSCKRNIGGIPLTESKWPHSLRPRGHTANQRAAYVTNRSGRWVEDSKICTQIPCGTNLLRSMSFMLQRKVSEILTHCNILDLVTLGTGTVLLVTVVAGIWPQYFTGFIGIWREM